MQIVGYCAFEFLFAEVIDLDFELDVCPVEKEALVVEGHGDALVIDGNIESHQI